jgi:hypothetical protein
MNKKPPLAIYVISHNDFEYRDRYNNLIYSTFNRDVKQYLNRSINIPVYFCDTSEKSIESIDIEGFENIVVVILIDNKMLINREINNLDNVTQNKKIKTLISVAISENSYKLSEYFSSHNLVRLYEQEDENKHDYLIIEIAHDVSKALINKERLKVFISHAKVDGKDMAITVQQSLSTQSHLSSFF